MGCLKPTLVLVLGPSLHVEEGRLLVYGDTDIWPNDLQDPSHDLQIRPSLGCSNKKMSLGCKRTMLNLNFWIVASLWIARFKPNADQKYLKFLANNYKLNCRGPFNSPPNQFLPPPISHVHNRHKRSCIRKKGSLLLKFLLLHHGHRTIGPNVWRGKGWRWRSWKSLLQYTP